MNTSYSRRITLLDSLILIAATAVGLAFLRWTLGDEDIVLLIRNDVIGGPAGSWDLEQVFGRAWLLELLLAPCLVSLSLAHCTLYLVPPRVPWRRLRRQTGFLTSALVVVAAGAAMLSYVECRRIASNPGSIEFE